LRRRRPCATAVPGRDIEQAPVAWLVRLHLQLPQLFP